MVTDVRWNMGEDVCTLRKFYNNNIELLQTHRISCFFHELVRFVACVRSFFLSFVHSFAVVLEEKHATMITEALGYTSLYSLGFRLTVRVMLSGYG